MSLTRELDVFNVAVSLGDIAPWSFDRSRVRDVLHYDLQTQLESTFPRRHGSGRAGFYRAHYLKGIGRTPAAANWNEPHDRYHGTGHLAASSAANERLVSAVAKGLGIEHTIVACRGLLAATLDRSERRQLATRMRKLSPADARLMTISVKRGPFARMSNVAFALDHFPIGAPAAGRLLLAIERALGVRRPSGEPKAFANAMHDAFERGVASFDAFARVGLAWLYTHNNFTLDGRFVDLELPLYVGVPFVGVALRRRKEGLASFFPGFEVFSFVVAWRGFLAYLLRRLDAIRSPLVSESVEVRAFIANLRRAIERRFGAKHPVFDDRAVIDRATATRADALGLDRRDRILLRRLAKAAFRGSLDRGLLKSLMPFRGASPPLTMEMFAPPFVPPPSPHANAFAEARDRARKQGAARAFLETVESGTRALCGL